MLFETKCPVTAEHTDEQGNVTVASLLYFAQLAATGHCAQLGLDWDTMAQKGLFWAVIRHKVLVSRLPAPGQQLTLRTWPMPTTRTYFPRIVEGFDEEGNRLFQVVSMWVLVDMQSRNMVLPGKSGIDVPGVTCGNEPAMPASVHPEPRPNSALWTVQQQDLDINGHVNNAKYLLHAECFAGDYRKDRIPAQVTVCYNTEARLGQDIRLDWSMDEGVLSVDGSRQNEAGKTDRIFSVRIEYKIIREEP